MDILNLIWVGMYRELTEARRLLPVWAMVFIGQSVVFLAMQLLAPPEVIEARLLQWVLATLLVGTIVPFSFRFAGEARGGMLAHIGAACRFPAALVVGRTLGAVAVIVVYVSVLSSSLLLLSGSRLVLPSGVYYVLFVVIIGSWGASLLAASVLQWCPWLRFAAVGVCALVLAQGWIGSLPAASAEIWTGYGYLTMLPLSRAFVVAEALTMYRLEWWQLTSSGFAAALMISALCYPVFGVILVHLSTLLIAGAGRWPLQDARPGRDRQPGSIADKRH